MQPGFDDEGSRQASAFAFCERFLGGFSLSHTNGLASRGAHSFFAFGADGLCS
jgi:hypothetical protein